MEFLELIEDRRSVRAYKPGVGISREELEKMVYAAQQAPSWKNSQTSRYYAILSSNKISEFRETCLPGFNYERTDNVAAIVVSTFEGGIVGFDPNGNPTDAHGDGWGMYDAGLATQNLILCARDLGFDTLIMGLRNEAKMRQMLGIPETQKIAAVIAVGKRVEDPAKPPRKDICELLKFF